MKSCMQCGSTASDDVVVCVCGREFAFVSNSDEQSDDDITIRGDAPRPTGKNAKLIGGILLVAGFVSFLFSFTITTTEYDGSLNLSALGWKSMLTWFGAGLLHLGLLVWLVGYVVHAISFLPTKVEQ